MLERVISSKIGWTAVRFDQMATQVNERVDNPAEAGVDRYVGLEHLDPDSLRIRRWGQPSDVESTKLRFQPGDIIFGKRRVYQRKIAVADTEGICSAHAMVLRARKDVVRPDFLPFFMQSDLFMDRALSISVGSLSPTINWKALAKEEFLLPPIHEQVRLVEFLVASAELVERLQDALSRLRTLQDAHAISLAAEMATSYPSIEIGDVAQVQYGLTVNGARRHDGETRPYLRVANVARGRLDLTEIKEIGVLEGDAAFELATDDILIVEGHAIRAEIGRACLWRNEIPGALHQNHLIRIRARSGLLPRYASDLINSPIGREYFQSRAKSSSGLNTINSSVVKKFKIPLPPPSVQESTIKRLDQLTIGESALEARIAAAKTVVRCALKETAGGSQ